MDSQFETLHEVIRDRITSEGAQYYALPWWEKEIAAFTADISIAISFINIECTDEELYWLSEVFEEIVEKTRSADFLDAVSKRSEIVVNQDYKNDIIQEINNAKRFL